MSALPLPAAPASFPVPSLALPGDLTLPAGRTAVMGILNVTPDSFSDGGRYADVAAALRHAREMVAAGADLIDVGVANGDRIYIYRKGLQMVACALTALVLGVGSARFAALTLVGLEGRGRRVSWRRINLLGGLAFDDPTVDLGCGSPLHLIGHMGIDIQRGAAGHMADDGRKGLDVHTVLQGSGGKGVA